MCARGPENSLFSNLNKKLIQLKFVEQLNYFKYENIPLATFSYSILNQIAFKINQICIVTLPPSAPVTSTSLNHFDILGRWSSSGPDRSIAHFFTATRNTIKGVGEKEQTNKTNNRSPGVNSKCKTRGYVTLCIPVSIYRLTLAWISSENSTTHEECWLILTRLPSLLWTTSHPTGLSAVRCRQPSSQSLCLTLWLAFPSYFRSRWDLESKPFVWFHAKTDKGIVCLADHLHSVIVKRNLDFFFHHPEWNRHV